MNSNNTSYFLKRQKQEKKEAIKTLLIEVLYNSLFQAIIKIYHTPHLALKLFLSIFVVCSSGMASFLSIKSIMTYFAYGVSATSRTINEAPAIFPKITFCNSNPLATEYSLKFVNMSRIYENFVNITNEDEEKIGHDLKDILISCYFNANPCYSSDFIRSYDSLYGNCYTFNSGLDSNRSKVALKQTNVAGWFFGLRLTFYIGIHESLLNFTDRLGAVIRIENSSYSTDDSHGGGTFVSPGEETFIAIERELQSMLPKPYSNCEIELNSPPFKVDLEFYNLIRKSSYAYSQQLCLLQCMHKYSIDMLKCSIPFGISLYNYSLCDLIEFEIIESYFVVNSMELYRKCLSLCPFECYRRLYKTSLSSIHLNENNYFIFLIKNNSN